MATGISEIFDSILGKLETMAQAKTVLGDPVSVGDKTVIPVVKIGLGFGAGGADVGEDNKKVNSGGGGAGLGINPVGFIVIEGDKVAFLPVKQKGIGSLVEMLPTLIEKVAGMKCGKKECCCKDEEDEAEE